MMCVFFSDVDFVFLWDGLFSSVRKCIKRVVLKSSLAIVTILQACGSAVNTAIRGWRVSEVINLLANVAKLALRFVRRFWKLEKAT